MSMTTLQVRLHPTPEQGRLLMAHCMEYIRTVNVLVAAFDSDVLDQKSSTKDFKAGLPSAVKNQALRDAHSVFKRSFELGCIPILKKPICQWDNQNWEMTDCLLTLPMYVDGKVQQVFIACDGLVYIGKPGILRIKKKRGKWIADITLTQDEVLPTDAQAVMGIDLGVKVPAVAHVRGKGTHFFGNGRYQRPMRRRFYARWKNLQKAKKTRAVRKSKGKEARWMKNSWSFYQVTAFISYKAERLGMTGEQVDPAYTSQECPACSARNKAQDRTYVCAECGWMGRRDKVRAINSSRRAGLPDKRVGAVGA